MEAVKTTRTPNGQGQDLLSPSHLRDSVVGGSSISSGDLARLGDAATDFVAASLGYPLRRENHVLGYACWPSCDYFTLPPLAAHGASVAAGQITELSVAWIDEAGETLTLAEDKRNLDLTGTRLLVRFESDKPQMSTKTTLPLTVSYTFDPLRMDDQGRFVEPHSNLVEAVVVVFRAMYESRLANVSFRSMDVRKSITSLLAGQRRYGARYA